MTHDDIIKSFLNSGAEELGRGNLRVESYKLMTYDEVLSEWKDGLVWVNPNKYSKTSSRHKSKLIDQLKAKFRVEGANLWKRI